jgi:hypothetical protein
VTHSAPFIKQVTEFGDTQKVVATEDIRNDQGVSLVKQGARIDSSLYERLVQHKLLRPIDYSVSIENPVTPLSLVTDAKRLLSNEADLVQAVDGRFIERDLLPVVGSIHLEPRLSIKLKLCRENTPWRYQHMLRITLIALHVAARLRWPVAERQVLAAAAIFHDLGEMHLDPDLFDGQPLDLVQRHQIVSHPTIAYLFLKEFPVYHPHVSLAVYQHHERLDGSGYPKGLSGDDVVPAARVIGATELLAVIRLEPERRDGLFSSIAEILSFNSDRFGKEIILPLIEASKRIEECGMGMAADRLVMVNKEELQARMKLLQQMLHEAEVLGDGSNDEMTTFICGQLGRISEMANRCCANLHTSDDLLEIFGNDHVALSELDALVREMIFLVQSTAREAMRRWPIDELSEHHHEPLTRWLKQAETLIQTGVARASARR